MCTLSLSEANHYKTNSSAPIIYLSQQYPTADNSLADSPHLTLEFGSNENVIKSANLSSDESTPRIWDTDEVIGLVEIFEDFKVSVWTEDANNERQLVGFVELNGRKLYDDTESRYGKNYL
ncbi:hypothetical protein CPB86DRAFT_799234 [Serendipita vermifera]|nr:hypothetical protein CPB86DRAFT_799234 [Serendipita vermifera]